MRTEQPQMIYLKDYQAPDYLIDETHLTFELFEDHTLVHAQLLMRRNPARGAGLPALRLDAVLMEQVLFNLLDNAAKYAPEGSLVRIEAWQETRREGDAVSLTILDEGEGIPEGDEERIFDTFYRVRKSDRVRAGTGLGLAISRGFVEAMGGRITARNRGDRPDSASPGAAFTLILPVPRTALEDAA